MAYLSFTKIEESLLKLYSSNRDLAMFLLSLDATILFIKCTVEHPKEATMGHKYKYEIIRGKYGVTKVSQ